MKFGIFDHIDRREIPIHALYRDRLNFAEAADKAGFYGYHIAEHHQTPLGMAPSPNVYLAALAERTKRMRVASMVHLLPLYEPIRLIEEICMLDHLSGGRFDLGVGRGVSPYETGYFGVTPQESRVRFEEMLEIVLKGLTSDSAEPRIAALPYSTRCRWRCARCSSPTRRSGSARCRTTRSTRPRATAATSSSAGRPRWSRSAIAAYPGFWEKNKDKPWRRAVADQARR